MLSGGAVDQNSASTKLHLQLDALRTERDAALSRLERLEAEAEERQRMLGEEQDRFVSRLIEAHERELSKVRLEVEEAQSSALTLESKVERQRRVSISLEEQLAKTRTEVIRTREQREAFRAEARRLERLLSEAQAKAASLHAELEMARAMLGDAMGGAGFQTAPPARTTHEPPRAPRESGIRSRPPARKSTPPGHTRTRDPGARRDTPRPAAAVGGTRESDGPPPSSR